MSIILFTGEIGQVTTRKDRTVRIVLESATELTDPMELAALFSLKANTVNVAIKESTFSQQDVEAIPEPERIEDSKSPASRLRGTLWVWWDQKGRTGDFESFYRVHMDRLVNQIKEKLT